MADGTNDNRSPGGALRLRASPWALLLPTAVITTGYGLLLLLLFSRGLGDGAVARLCMVVLGFAAPFIAAHAVLRLITVEVRPMGHALVLRRGFPQAGAVEIPWDDIAKVSVRLGPGGRLTGSGTLVILRTDGRRFAVADLDAPLMA
ncbi:MAG: PH domain-containing protein, partial [Rhizobiaceae bacterium]